MITTADRSSPNQFLFEQAWIIGGSVAGMLAAGALSKHCREVFIVDRDHTLGEPSPRKGALKVVMFMRCCHVA